MIIVPIAISVIVYGWATWCILHSPPGYIGQMVQSVFVYGLATIIALLSWLIWALMLVAS